MPLRNLLDVVEVSHLLEYLCQLSHACENEKTPPVVHGKLVRFMNRLVDYIPNTSFTTSNTNRVISAQLHRNKPFIEETSQCTIECHPNAYAMNENGNDLNVVAS